MFSFSRQNPETHSLRKHPVILLTISHTQTGVKKCAKTALFKAESGQKQERSHGRDTEVHTPTEGRRNSPRGF